MRLSIFDPDDNFGEVSGGWRPVVLRGTVEVSQLFSPNLFNIGDWIKTALQNNGFSVVNVRTSAAGYVGYANNVEIELNVFNEFTSEQARVNAIAAIEAYRANFGFNKVFYNTTLSVAFDGYKAPSTGGGGSTSKPPVPNPSKSPPSNYDKSSDKSDGSDGISSFFDKLGLGLGVSTPIAILIAAGVAIVILRK